MTDVIVVGAGPAGSALATLLASAGRDVLLLDRAAFPRPKACAEYVSPGVVRLLHELGAGERIEQKAGRRLRGFIVEAYGRSLMSGAFGRAPGWPDAPAFGLGVTREIMDAELVALAREAGAVLRERTRVTDVLREDNAVTGVRALTDRGTEEFRAPLVVGADGVAGVVGRRLGMVSPRPNMRRFALVAHLTGMSDLGDHGEMHVGTDGYCGVAPLGDGLANVAMVLRPRRDAHLGSDLDTFLREKLDSFGDLGRRTADAHVVGPVLRTGPLSYRAKTVVNHGVLLAGDAGGFYDPFTGQGVYKALRSAQLAAPVLQAALAAGDVSRGRLMPYERARRREFRGSLAVEWLIQRFLGRPALLRRALHLLGERQIMADTLVGVTGDVLPARRVLSPLFLVRLAF